MLKLTDVVNKIIEANDIISSVKLTCQFAEFGFSSFGFCLHTGL